MLHGGLIVIRRGRPSRGRRVSHGSCGRSGSLSAACTPPSPRPGSPLPVPSYGPRVVGEASRLRYARPVARREPDHKRQGRVGEDHSCSDRGIGPATGAAKIPALAHPPEPAPTAGRADEAAQPTETNEVVQAGRRGPGTCRPPSPAAGTKWRVVTASGSTGEADRTPVRRPSCLARSAVRLLLTAGDDGAADPLRLAEIEIDVAGPDLRRPDDARERPGSVVLGRPVVSCVIPGGLAAPSSQERE